MSSLVHELVPEDAERTISASQLVAEATFQITVSPVKTQTTGVLTVTGSGSTGATVDIHYLHVPGAPGNIRRRVPVHHGTFTDESSWPLINGSAEDADVDVYVMARDEASGAIDVRSVKASVWVVN